MDGRTGCKQAKGGGHAGQGIAGHHSRTGQDKAGTGAGEAEAEAYVAAGGEEPVLEEDGWDEASEGGEDALLAEDVFEDVPTAAPESVLLPFDEEAEAGSPSRDEADVALPFDDEESPREEP